jgi:hypothetical protein
MEFSIEPDVIARGDLHKPRATLAISAMSGGLLRRQRTTARKTTPNAAASTKNFPAAGDVTFQDVAHWELTRGGTRAEAKIVRLCSRSPASSRAPRGERSCR